MTLVLRFGFYEPWSGAWMLGERKLWVADENDAWQTERRYTNYFKATYGDSAEVVRLALEED